MSPENRWSVTIMDQDNAHPPPRPSAASARARRPRPAGRGASPSPTSIRATSWSSDSPAPTEPSTSALRRAPEAATHFWGPDRPAGWCTVTGLMGRARLDVAASLLAACLLASSAVRADAPAAGEPPITATGKEGDFLRAIHGQVHFRWTQVHRRAEEAPGEGSAQQPEARGRASVHRPLGRQPVSVHRRPILRDRGLRPGRDRRHQGGRRAIPHPPHRPLRRRRGGPRQVGPGP